ncbi:hypothetical protein [Picrophilus oshimae]|uniref:Uncharacterized protein n=1 Tax=Picrophilus torridus (strain ATCC 700027 / DSM 9790 / JCM 10055 / NBRC 100828 / KAW 2/3) TaxID=1122961 RepID=Q6L260_PICTO|nr:hypothetical protein [Picrophilus oshimae]AAT42942.1 hypothetical protein PTO0357 [Picrophilus oshimae DSM 9789]
MVRSRGDKGKHGETDREIIFALCLNMISGHGDGLSQFELSSIVEKNTNKEREGIRKRIAYLTSDKSPIYPLMKKLPPKEGKRKIVMEINNLLDVAKLYVFMEKSPELVSLLEEFFYENLRKYITDVVDILQLWDPGDPNYGLPVEICRKFETERVVSFDPKLYPETGPSYLKLIGKRFQVFNSYGFCSIECLITGVDSLEGDFNTNMSIFSHLILDFFQWSIEQSKITKNIQTIYTVRFEELLDGSDYEKFAIRAKPAEINKECAEYIFFKVPVNLQSVKVADSKNKNLELEYKWFLDIWKKAWDRAISGELLVHATYDDFRDLGVSIPKRTPKTVSEALGIPVRYVKYDKTRENRYISYRLPKKLMPKMKNDYYPQVLFVGNGYVLRRIICSPGSTLYFPDVNKPDEKKEMYSTTYSKWIYKEKDEDF